MRIPAVIDTERIKIQFLATLINAYNLLTYETPLEFRPSCSRKNYPFGAKKIRIPVYPRFSLLSFQRERAGIGVQQLLMNSIEMNRRTDNN